MGNCCKKKMKQSDGQRIDRNRGERSDTGNRKLYDRNMLSSYVPESRALDIFGSRSGADNTGTRTHSMFGSHAGADNTGTRTHSMFGSHAGTRTYLVADRAGAGTSGTRKYSIFSGPAGTRSHNLFGNCAGIEETSGTRMQDVFHSTESCNRADSFVEYRPSTARPSRVELEPLQLILFGPVGSGKSALGNMITRSEKFKRKSINMKKQSYTEIVQRQSVILSHLPLEVVVIDTPGIQEDWKADKIEFKVTVLNLIKNAMIQSGTQNPVYLFVLSLQQSLDHELIILIQKTLNTIIVGSFIIIFTNTYELSVQNNEISREEVLSLFPEKFAKFVAKNSIECKFLNIQYNNFEKHVKENSKKLDDLVLLCNEVANRIYANLRYGKVSRQGSTISSNTRDAPMDIPYN